MADVRIGINSEFNDSGFEAALQAINSLQSALKKNNTNMSKIANTVKKASGASDVDKEARKYLTLGRDIGTADAAMNRLVNTSRKLKTAQTSMNRSQQESKKILDGTRIAQALLSQAYDKGYKNTTALSKAQRMATSLQSQNNTAIRNNNKLMDEAKQKVNSFTAAQKVLSRVSREAAGKGDVLLKGDASASARYLQENAQTIEKWKKQLRDAQNVDRQLQDRQKRIATIMSDAGHLKTMNANDKAAIKALEDETRAIDRESAKQVAIQEKAQKEIARINDQAARAAARQAEATRTSLERQRQSAYANPDKQAADELKLLQQSYGNKAKYMQMGFGPNFAAGINVAASGLSRLISAATSAASAMTRLASAARSAGAALLNGIARAAQSVSQALSRIGSSANNGLTRLRNNLINTGKAALGFGKNVSSGMGTGNKALERSAAGWSLMMAGRTIGQTGRSILGGGALGIGNYMDFEAASTRAAISGNTDLSVIQDLVFGIERGQYGGQKIKGLGNTDIAQGVYYLTSALGLDVTKGNSADIAQMLAPMLQVAQYTQTSPETLVKGVLNMGMEFGLNPRADETGRIPQAQQFGQIAGLTGYLANISSMEVPDITEAFKMMGPMMNKVSPGSSMDNLMDAMAFTYFASNVGLKGGNVGRALDRFTSTLLAPSGPAMKAASQAFGIDEDENAWHEFFFDDSGKLKGGLEGTLQKFMSLPDNQGAQILASMFTQNATRGLVGAIAGMDSDKTWTELMDLLKGGDYQKAMELLANATTKTNDTVFASVQNMKNAWGQLSNSIINSIRGPIIDGLDTFANVFREISDLIGDFPDVGKFFAGFGAGIGILATVVGGLLSFAGVLLVLQRAFQFTGGAVPLITSILASIPGALLVAIPALLATAAAVVALKTAWEQNLFGMQDFANFLREGDISGYFATELLPKLDGVIIKLNKTKAAFSQFVNGILLGQGPTNNLGAWMVETFGYFLGSDLYGQMLRLQGALTNLRGSIKSFFTGIDGANISNATKSLQGFLELLVEGITSTSNMKAIDNIGKLFGIDNLSQDVKEFTDTLREGFLDFVSTLVPIFDSIRASFAEIFDRGTLDGLMDFVSGFAEGFAEGIGAAILAVGRAMDFLLQKVTQIGSMGQRFAGFIEQLTGVQLTLQNIGEVIGAVFGAALIGRILAVATPIGGIATLLAGVGVGFVQLGVNAGIAAARLALFAVSMAASAAASLIMSGSLGALVVVFGAIGIALAGVAAYSIGLQGSFNTIGALAQVAGAGFSYLRDNLVQIVSVAGSAAAALAAIWLVMNAGAIAGPVAMAVGIAALILALSKLTDLDVTGWFGGVTDAFDELFEALGNTDSIDSAEQVLVARIELFGAQIKAALLNAFAGAVNDVSRLSGIGAFMEAIGLPTATVLGIQGAADTANKDLVAKQNNWDYVRGAGLNPAFVAQSQLWSPTRQQPVTAVPGSGGVLQYTMANNGPKAPYTSNAAYQSIPFDSSWYGAAEGGYFDRKDPQNQLNNAVAAAYVANGNKLPPEIAAALYSLSGNKATPQQVYNAMAGYPGATAYVAAPAGGYPMQTVPNTAPFGSMVWNPATQTMERLNAGVSSQGFYSPSAYAAMQQNGIPTAPGAPTTKLSTAGSAIQSVMGLFESLGVGPEVSSFLNNMLGGNFISSDGSVDLDGLYKSSAFGSYDTFLKSLPPKLEETMRQQAAVTNYQNMIERIGKKQTDAFYRANEIPIPKPVDVEQAADAANQLAAMGGMDEDAWRQAQGEFNKGLSTNIIPQDLPTAMQQTFNGGPIMLPSDFSVANGRVPQYRAGATAVAAYGDAILSGLPEGASPQADINQLLADYVGLGGGEDNVLGKNLPELLRNDPGIQRFAQTFGLSLDDALKDVPQYMHSEQLMPTVMGDLLGGIDQMGPNLYSKLNDELNIDWTHLGQFAASQAEAGVKSWNLADFISQEWGMSIQEANDYIAEHGLDPNVINESLFKDTQQAVNSAFGTVGLISDDTWDLIGTQLNDASDKIIDLTQETFDKMSTSEKQALTDAGYVFHITVDGDVDTSGVESALQEGVARIEDALDNFRKETADLSFDLDIALPATPVPQPTGIQMPDLSGLGNIDVTADLPEKKVSVSADLSAAQAAVASWEVPDKTVTITPVIVGGESLTTLPGTGAGPLAGLGASLNPFGGGGGDAGGTTISISVTADTGAASSALQQVGSLAQQVGGIQVAPTVTANTGQATSAIQTVLGLLRQADGFNATPQIIVSSNADSVVGSALSQLRSIDGYVATATVQITQVGSVPSVGSIGAGFSSAAAAGGFHTGLTLVGEEGPEIANFGSSGAYVYTAQETQAILRNSRSATVASSSSSGGTTTVINLNGPHEYKNEMDAVKVVNLVEREIGRRQRRATRGTVSSAD